LRREVVYLDVLPDERLVTDHAYPLGSRGNASYPTAEHSLCGLLRSLGEIVT
jgi:hypothetical protein